MRVLKDNSKFIVVDLEATCWEDKDYQLKNSEVLEIGVCLVDLETRKMIDKESYLIKIKGDLSSFCTDLTGISNEMMKDALPLQKASKMIRMRFKTKNIAWGGWGDDFNILLQDCEKKGAVFPFSDNYHNISQFYCWQNGIKRGIGLKRALLEKGFTFDGQAHRALPDAENTVKLFLDIFKN